MIEMNHPTYAPFPGTKQADNFTQANFDVTGVRKSFGARRRRGLPRVFSHAQWPREKKAPFFG